MCNFKRYWNDTAATRSAVTDDGYFLTGDIGLLDEDGYLFIVDRKKDIIIRGGENISCLEVEAAIYHHPAVAECAVFGLAEIGRAHVLTHVTNAHHVCRLMLEKRNIRQYN